MTFGKYPDVSLSLARNRHADSRTLLAAGVDPMALRKAEKSAEQVADQNSFTTIADQWFEHWKHGKSPRHVDSTRRRLNSNILSTLGARQITDIEAPDVLAMVRVSRLAVFVI